MARGPRPGGGAGREAGARCRGGGAGGAWRSRGGVPFRCPRGRGGEPTLQEQTQRGARAGMSYSRPRRKLRGQTVSSLRSLSLFSDRVPLEKRPPGHHRLSRSPPPPPPPPASRPSPRSRGGIRPARSPPPPPPPPPPGGVSGGDSRGRGRARLQSASRVACAYLLSGGAGAGRARGGGGHSGEHGRQGGVEEVVERLPAFSASGGALEGRQGEAREPGEAPRLPHHGPVVGVRHTR